MYEILSQVIQLMALFTDLSSYTPRPRSSTLLASLSHRCPTPQVPVARPLNSYAHPTSCLLTPAVSVTRFPEYINLVLYLCASVTRVLFDKLGHEPNLHVESTLTVSGIPLGSPFTLMSPHCKANFNSGQS